jgi:hypothetical protein
MGTLGSQPLDEVLAAERDALLAKDKLYPAFRTLGFTAPDVGCDTSNAVPKDSPLISLIEKYSGAVPATSFTPLPEARLEKSFKLLQGAFRRPSPNRHHRHGTAAESVEDKKRKKSKKHKSEKSKKKQKKHKDK